MPWASPEQNNEFIRPAAIGPVMQCSPILPNAVSPTIAASGNWQSGIIASDGYKAIAVGATLSQAGSISIQRYLDMAGLVPVGAPVSATLVANTANAATVNDGVAFASFQVTISNSGASTGNLSNVAVLLNAA